ncbi:hypothetical protein B0H13DRAFT_1877434 [Mycena leptocephala]|nr:hypothetical protein B0H13DRAFT_1877434 [Mycena leptocephala]
MYPSILGTFKLPLTAVRQGVNFFFSDPGFGSIFTLVFSSDLALKQKYAEFRNFIVLRARLSEPQLTLFQTASSFMINQSTPDDDSLELPLQYYLRILIIKLLKVHDHKSRTRRQRYMYFIQLQASPLRESNQTQQ